MLTVRALLLCPLHHHRMKAFHFPVKCGSNQIVLGCKAVNKSAFADTRTFCDRIQGEVPTPGFYDDLLRRVEDPIKGYLFFSCHIFPLLIFDWSVVYQYSTNQSKINPETLVRQQHEPASLADALSAFGRLLGMKRFTALALSGSFTMAGLFVYIGASSFIFTQHFGLSPTGYSLVFAANAVGMVVFGQINMQLLNRWSAEKLLRGGLLLHAAAVAALVVTVLVGVDRVVIIGPLIFLAVVALSLIFGNITAEVMDSAPQDAGAASSLFGVLGYVLASAAGAVLAFFHNGTLMPPIIVMFGCAIIAIVAHRIGQSAK